MPLHVKILSRLELHGLIFEGGEVSQKEPTGVSPGSHPQPSGEGYVYVNVSKGRKGKGGKGKGKTPKPREEIPPELNAPEFLKAWDDFKAYRQEINKPQTEVGARRTLARLAKHGSEKATAAIYATIENRWTGVDPDWLNRNGAGRKPAAPDRDYAKGLEL